MAPDVDADYWRIDVPKSGVQRCQWEQRLWTQVFAAGEAFATRENALAAGRRAGSAGASHEPLRMLQAAKTPGCGTALAAQNHPAG